MLYLLILLVSILDFLHISDPFKELLFTRPTVVIGLRGASSIFSEPSFLALSIFCLMALSKDLFKDNFWGIIFPGFLSILSFSTMAIFPLILAFYRLRNGHKLFVLACIILTIPLILKLNIRITAILTLALENPELLLKDNSVNSRLGYIVRDIQVFLENYTLPIIPGYYPIIISNYPAETIYNPYLPGSLMGYWIVQLGLVTPILLLRFIFRFKKGRMERLLLTIMSVQMISLAFILVPYTIGYLSSEQRKSI